MLIYDTMSIFYLTGQLFEPGERLLLLKLNDDNSRVLFINKLFYANEVPNMQIVYYSDEEDAVAIVAKHITKDTVHVDKNMPARFLLPLINLKHGVQFELSNAVELMRLVKTHDEIQIMREASALTDTIIAKLIASIKQNVTELELVDIFKQICKSYGVTELSFEPIVAFGENASAPHHVPTDKVIQPGDCVVLDVGIKHKGYCSDMTRTVFYKHVSESDRFIYETVLEANKLAIEKVKPGAKFCDVDNAARDYITSKGYGEYFTHRTGHSIGLECHEYCAVSNDNEMELKPGMIFSVEPGIYHGIGVRIEDLILVTQTSYELLNNYTKELTVIQ